MTTNTLSIPSISSISTSTEVKKHINLETTQKQYTKQQTVPEKLSNMDERMLSLKRTKDQRIEDTLTAIISYLHLDTHDSNTFCCGCDGTKVFVDIAYVKNDNKITYRLCEKHMKAYRAQKKLDLMEERNNIQLFSCGSDLLISPYKYYYASRW